MKMTGTFQIEGMHCGACVGRVDKALRAVPGVRSAAVNLTTGMANVEFDAVPTPEQTVAIVQAVQGAGYNAIALRDASAATLRAVAQRGADAEGRQKFRLMVGMVLGVPVVAFHMLMLPAFPGSALLELLVSTVIMLVAGWPYFVRGIPALFGVRPDMDTLVAIGAGTAYVASVPGSIMGMQHAGMHHGAFDEYHAAITIVVLVTLGKFLEARAKKFAGAAVGGLAIATSPEATIVRADGTTERISVEAVAIGDALQVAAHQTAPVDGQVIEGAGSLDQSLLTGESVPVSLAVGSKVPGGAKLVDGRIVMRATATAAQSTIARITELVQQAQASRTQIQRLADRVAGIFVPIVLLLAVATFIGWIGHSADLSMALMATVATVVIACPCAMGLATPTAITVAMGRGAKLGILFTKATALEMGQRIDTVIFDKTGTLTRGELEVAGVMTAGSSPKTAADPLAVVALAGALEQYSEHPIALAIMRHAELHGLKVEEPTGFSSVPGGGLRGQIKSAGVRQFLAIAGQGTPGHEVVVGSTSFLRAQGIAVADDADLPLTAQGITAIGVARDGQLLGMIGLKDTLRADAVATIAELRRRGIKVGVVSGDSEAAVRGTLANIPIDFVHADIRPEEKAAIIKQLAADGSHHIAFVGDGTNDGPALAAADLGIALATGTDLARSAGDVILVSPQLAAVPQTLALADATMRIIRQNLVWAFGYNVLAIPLAMLNILPPGIAAGAMMLSSISVVLNALRLNRAGQSA
jgi:heavy metal translocating P-type ATPase